jgi:phage gpG-like protein
VDKFNFKDVIARLEQTKKDLPIRLANDTKNYFLSSWSKQGFDGVKWQEVKRREVGTVEYLRAKPSARTRAILVQSGRLRRDVANSLKQANWDSIIFKVSNPYAAVHNYGNEGIAHSVGFHSRVTKRTKTKKNTAIRISEVKEHFRRGGIPQRQFMGDTKELRNKQLDLIKRSLGGIWR